MIKKLISLFHNPYLFIFLKSIFHFRNFLNEIKFYKLIKKSRLFDDKYYCNNYKNIVKSGFNPLIHYLYYGYYEGKIPSKNFNGNYFINQNKKNIEDSGINPLLYYILFADKKIKDPAKISIVIVTYNHEKYIQECLDSALMQKGNFDIEIIIGDDNSQDNTPKIIKEYIEKYPKIIKTFPKTENMGTTKNYKRCFEATTGDFIAPLEGDDYWKKDYKLQKQLDFLNKRQDCAFCFNSIYLEFVEGNQKDYILPSNLNKDTLSTNEIITNYAAGNFSCYFYRKEVVDNLPKELYDIVTYDWFFNILNSTYGNLGFINEDMTVYRQHSDGLWTGTDFNKNISDLLDYIDIYNEFLDFKYDKEFKIAKIKFASTIS